MSSWAAVAITGLSAAAVGAVLLLGRWRKLRRGGGYISVPSAQEPADPLLRSQLTACLSESPSKRRNALDNLRGWATGTSDLSEEFEDLSRQVRSLQTYVLDLDSRYLRREEAAWLSLQISALLLGVATGVSTAVWALIELAK